MREDLVGGALQVAGNMQCCASMPFHGQRLTISVERINWTI